MSRIRSTFPVVPEPELPFTSVSDIHRSEAIEGEVLLTGLITSLDRKVNGALQPWADITLRDRCGSISIVSFPKTFRLVADRLTVGQLITVRGRLNDTGQGEIEVFARELTINGEQPIAASQLSEALDAWWSESALRLGYGLSTTPVQIEDGEVTRRSLSARQAARLTALLRADTAALTNSQ